MEQEPIRAVIIGTGGIAKSHVNAVRQANAPVELVGAMDIDAERVQAFAAEHGVPSTFTDADGTPAFGVDRNATQHPCRILNQEHGGGRMGLV